MTPRAMTKIVKWDHGQAKTTVAVDAEVREAVLATGSVLWIQHTTGMLSCLSSVGGNVEAVTVPDQAWAEVIAQYFS